MRVCILSGSKGDPEPEQGVLLLYFAMPERLIHIITCYSTICLIVHKEISLDIESGRPEKLILWCTWALVTISFGASNSVMSINIFLQPMIVQDPKLDNVKKVIGGLNLKPRFTHLNTHGCVTTIHSQVRSIDILQDG